MSMTYLAENNDTISITMQGGGLAAIVLIAIAAAISLAIILGR